MNRALVLLVGLALALPGCICAPGMKTCDDGCADVRTDISNCGACGNVCGLGQLCIDSACVGGSTARCDSDEACSDGDFCTGTEHCVDGFCRPGRAVVCDDGVSCTTETCSNTERACVARATSGACPVGQQCTGAAGAARGCE